ncbi:MAG TPA: O-antigen ligase family protein [Bryobacteraceae bacterium]|nr:O-antigen ligase family protein [Bryobacteraceae bacterium]
MAVLVPAAILPEIFFYYDVTPKAVLVLAGAAVSLWLFSRPAGNPASWLGRLLGAQAASLILATVLSENVPLSFGGSNWRRLGLATHISILLIIWLVSRAAAAASLLLWVRAAAVAGLAPALYGVAQYFGWDPWLPAAAYHAGEGSRAIVRPPSTLGHAIYFANYLVGTAFSGVAVAMADRSPGWRRFGCVSAGVAAVAILLSGTRGALAGLVVGAVLLAVPLRGKVTRRSLAVAAAAAGLLTAFFFSPAGAKLRNRVLWALEEPPGGARLLLWRDTLHMAPRYWLYGAGPEVYSAVFPQFQSVALSRQYSDFYHESPHNVFLDALISQGLPGLAILALLATFALRAAWRSRGDPSSPALPLGAGLFALVVAHLFACFTIPTLLCFYWTVALLAALKPVLVRERNPARRLIRAGNHVLAAVMLLYAVRLAVADRALAVTRAHLDAGRLAEGLRAYERHLRWRPPGMDAELWYSRRLLVAAQASSDWMHRTRAFTEALRAARRATIASEQPANAWYNLAMLEAARNHAPAAERALRAAAAAAPTWYKPHWMLARLYRRLGRLEQAEAEAALALRFYGGREPEVAATWKEIRTSRNSLTLRE